MTKIKSEVSFTIKKPYAKTSEVVKANSSIAARHIIEAQYGKENITIHSVKQLKKLLLLLLS